MISPHDAMQALLKLTGIRDADRLDDALVVTLQELTQAELVLLKHHISTKEDGYTVERISYTGNPDFKADIGHEDCSTCSKVRDNNEQLCLSCHVDVNGGKESLSLRMCTNSFGYNSISMLTRSLADEERQLIVDLIHVYQNFKQVFISGETDTLTGLLNRKSFDQRIISIVNGDKDSNHDEQGKVVHEVINERRQDETNCSYWIGVADIDHFKSINDNFGHLYGDEVLVLLARLMKQVFRADDLLFRYGGEEFVVVLKSCRDGDAMNVFERLRKAVENYRFPQVGKVTTSIGFTEFRKGTMVSELFDKADIALYYAKEHGRNQVHNYEKLLQEGKVEKAEKEDSDIELF